MSLYKTGGMVFNIQPFSIHDGPGIRTTVFLKGCNLRCRWCHNPEAAEAGPEIRFISAHCIQCGACAAVCPHAAEGQSARFTSRCEKCGACAAACYAGALDLAGRYWEADELAELLLKDRELLKGSGGGITFSGGEPLLQADFIAAVFSRLKKEGIHTAVETAACVPWENFEKILPLTGLFICDIKAPGEDLHREGTGVGNTPILENLRHLSGAGAEILLRVPVIPGYNDREELIREIGLFIQSLGKKHPVELLAFHNICAGKYDSLKREFPLRNLAPPSPALMERLTSTLEALKLEVIRRP